MPSSTTTDLEAQLGERVRQVRRSQGVSQAELARLANVSRSAIVSLEAGAGSSLRTLVRALEALGHSDWLLSLEAPNEVFNPLDLLDDGPRRSGPGRRSRPPTAATRHPR